MSNKIVLNFSENATEEEIEEINTIIEDKFPTTINGKIFRGTDINITLLIELSVPISISLSLLIPIVSNILERKTNKKLF